MSLNGLIDLIFQAFLSICLARKHTTFKNLSDTQTSAIASPSKTRFLLWPLVSGQYTSLKDVMVRALESSATLVGRHALKLTVLFLETIRKPLELKRPGTFPTSSQTKGATEAEWRVTEYPVSSCCTLACRETHTLRL